MSLLEKFSIGAIRIELADGPTLKELRTAGDLTGFSERAHMLEAYFEHFEPIIEKAELEVSLAPKASRRDEVFDELLFDLGLKPKAEAPVDATLKQNALYRLQHYLTALMEVAPDESKAFFRGELDTKNFPAKPMRIAAAACAKKMGESIEASAMRKRLKGSCDRLGWELPVPRDNSV